VRKASAEDKAATTKEDTKSLKKIEQLKTEMPP